MASIGPDVRVFKDPAALGEAAAVVLAETANRAVADRGRFSLCLSGGHTPQLLYSLLAQSPHRDLIQWERVHAFWGDDRCVPAEDLNSNYRMAQELLLRHVPLPPGNIHRIRTELEPELAAEDYTLVLRKYAEPPLEWPRFDLVLLGVAEDGHTAGLLPGFPEEPRSPMLAVGGQGQGGTACRITMTPLVFNSARLVVLMAQGADKSRIIARVLYGNTQAELLPVQRINPQDGHLVWMLDAGAANRA